MANVQIVVGNVYNKLTPIRLSETRQYHEETWVCKCECGEETLATKSQLIHGNKKSCGCLRRSSPPNLIDLTGRRFGKLLVLGRDGRTNKDNATWLCRCDCGKEVPATGTTLRRGETTSCGCQRPAYAVNARSILLNEKSIDGIPVPLLTKKVRSDSSTGHKGVAKRVRRGKTYYEAYIQAHGKRKHLLTTTDKEKAVEARKKAEIEYYGPYIKALEEKENEARRDQEVD